MSNSIRRAGLTILFGSAGGMVITLAAAPVISRLYSPSEFGFYAVLLAAASALIGASSLRLEILAQAEAGARRQAALLKISIISVTVVSIIISAIAATVVALTELSALWILVGPMVWMGSAPSIGTATLVLERKYKAVAIQNFMLHSGTSGAQVITGFTIGGPLGLAIGFLAGRCTWLPRIFRWARKPHEDLRQSWQSIKGPARAAGGSALVNSGASQILPILLTLTYGSATAGLVAMALRVAISPITVVGQAVSSATSGEVGLAVRSAEIPLAREKIKRGMRDQAIFAAPILGIIAVAAPIFAGPVLGPEWSRAGIAISLLAFGGYAQFIVAPFSQVLNLTGRTVHLLKWDILRFASLGVALLIPYWLGLSWEYSVGAYSIVQVPLYSYMALEIFRATDVRNPPRE